MRYTGAAALAFNVVLVSACGGGQPPTAAEKRVISRAALTISIECRNESPEAASIEDAVTVLRAQREKFGDQRFTISNTLRDVTVGDIAARQAKVMREEKCEPAQASRLAEAS